MSNKSENSRNFEYGYRKSLEEESSLSFLYKNLLNLSEKFVTQASYISSINFYLNEKEFTKLGQLDADAYLNPLISFLETRKNEHNLPVVLDVGCGSGRNALKLMIQGYRVHVVDYSSRFVEAASNWVINLPDDAVKFLTLDTSSTHDNEYQFQGTIADLTLLGVDFVQAGTFDAALAESALCYLNPHEVLPFLTKVYRWLKPGGICTFRLKLTDHGQAYVIHDRVGTRFYTSWTQQDIDQLKNDLRQIGYELNVQPEDEQIIEHKDAAAGTPAFYQLTIRKPASPVTGNHG
jgi:SAM-dependent methyltransferase